MHYFHLRLMLSDQPKFQKKLSLFTSTKKGYPLRAVLPKKSNRIFHHFPITRNLVLVKCRQFSVLGVTRGSLGSACSTTELRPLVVSDFDFAYRGLLIFSALFVLMTCPSFCRGFNKRVYITGNIKSWPTESGSSRSS